ncbi:hypothetical protein J0910_16385 [Nocardiopsis sp. CNT-189]|uniref:hypothetical protein n=1 Tax=Nocardiopsis oceanisediminis TaxID=2816862 RepID=UPI003B344142
MSDETVRTGAPAPSSRVQAAVQRVAPEEEDRQRTVLAAELRAELGRTGRVVVHPAYAEQGPLLKSAIRRAAREIGEKARIRTLEGGALSAVLLEEPGP